MDALLSQLTQRVPETQSCEKTLGDGALQIAGIYPPLAASKLQHYVPPVTGWMGLILQPFQPQSGFLQFWEKESLRRREADTGNENGKSGRALSEWV